MIRLVEYEPTGNAFFCAPRCRCGTRGQKKIGVMVWRCSSCSRVNHYRMTTEGFLPFTREVAESIDAQRRGEL